MAPLDAQPIRAGSIHFLEIIQPSVCFFFYHVFLDQYLVYIVDHQHHLTPFGFHLPTSQRLQGGSLQLQIGFGFGLYSQLTLDMFVINPSY